jgi:tetratricopeptide (TPR) repeat protein
VPFFAKKITYLSRGAPRVRNLSTLDKLNWPVQKAEGFFEGMRRRWFGAPMSTSFDNVYDLTADQLQLLDDAEEMMLRNDLGAAERLLLSMLEADEACIPVLSNLGHLYGRHLSEFETAIEYYDRVLAIEPDNAWARDARRRYLRYV